MPFIHVGDLVSWQMGSAGGGCIVLEIRDNMAKVSYEFGKHWLPLCSCPVCQSKPQWPV